VPKVSLGAFLYSELFMLSETSKFFRKKDNQNYLAFNFRWLSIT